MKSSKKIIFILLLCICALAFFAFSDQLSLSSLKEQKNFLLEYYQKEPLLFTTSYFIIYVLSTAISIPGATVITLAGGAIFGFIKGLLVVSFASTIGATLAFLLSRYVLRDYLEKRFNSQLAVINDGFEKEGTLYLFALRLVPLFPFFLVNLLMGLTRIHVKKYFIISQIGMLPGTAAYVFAGLELARINQASDIISLNILIAFSIIGILPLLSKKLIHKLRSNEQQQG